MHELSICRSMVGIVRNHADGRAVREIHLQVGQLRQIIPDTLRYCWGMVSEETELAGSELVIDHIPARIECRDCQHVTLLSAPVLRCEHCDSTEVTLVTGEEFLMTSLELAEA